MGTPLRTESPRARKLTNTGIVALSVLILGAGGAVVAQQQSAQQQAAQAAATYTPAVTYTAPPEPTKVAFLGDSFTGGTGADNKSSRWTTQLARDNQWLEVNYGFGGTNYATGGTNKGGKPYWERLPDLVRAAPDIVIVSSAGNDMEDDQTPGIKRTFQELREELPDARIIATSPYYRAEDFPVEFTEFADEIKEAVESVDGEYLDIGHPLDGHPEGMDEDKVHPNDKGYALIAEAVQDALDDA